MGSTTRAVHLRRLWVPLRHNTQHGRGDPRRPAPRPPPAPLFSPCYARLSFIQVFPQSSGAAGLRWRCLRGAFPIRTHLIRSDQRPRPPAPQLSPWRARTETARHHNPPAQPATARPATTRNGADATDRRKKPTRGQAATRRNPAPSRSATPPPAEPRAPNRAAARLPGRSATPPPFGHTDAANARALRHTDAANARPLPHTDHATASPTSHHPRPHHLSSHHYPVMISSRSLLAAHPTRTVFSYHIYNTHWRKNKHEPGGD